MRYAWVFGLSYLLGGVLFGPLVARARGVDLYSTGSGNPGTTNVERTLGRGPAALVLLLDAGKGVVGVLLAHLLGVPGAAPLGLLGSLLGHVAPVHAPTRGGKGVATLLGGAAAVDPWAGLAFAVAYVAGRKLTGYGSVGSLVASTAAMVTWAARDRSAVVIAVAAGALVVVFARHHDNLARLRAGTEPKAGRDT